MGLDLRKNTMKTEYQPEKEKQGKTLCASQSFFRNEESSWQCSKCSMRTD